MKTVLLSVCMTVVSLQGQSAQAAGSSGLSPTQTDQSICNPIFSKLDQLEQGAVLAQAQTQQPSQAAKTPQNQPKKPQKQTSAPNEKELTTQLSAMLQACSYDGKALSIDPRAMKLASGPDGAKAVQNIMRFTGLPQNFTIMESDVPNAAAIIVLGKDGIPQRVIAYNRQFMQQVARATGEDVWPATSILAHEIGHHLSGHTLLPGGSQPPIELEADKFSGFVLFKMGATLVQAEKAIATLVPEADGPTHPGRRKRLMAIEAGWLDSCLQQRETCGDDTVVAAAEPRQPSVPAQVEPQSTAPSPTLMSTTEPGGEKVPLPDIPGATDIAMPDLNKAKSGQADMALTGAIDRMPKLDDAAVPSKFDRFVYDEAGVFDPAVRDKLQRIAFQFAAATHVEIVTIVAKDLQGRTADQYALDVMRQLRVGKMDVGNGAVLVVSPDRKETGVALGPGLLVQYRDVEPLRGDLKGFLGVVAGGGKPRSASSLIADASYRIMRDTKSLEWAVRFNSLDEMQATAAKAQADLKASGAAYEPSKDPTWRKLLRIDATIISTSPDRTDRKLGINEPKTRFIGPAMHARTTDGKDVVLYVNRNVTALMPVGLEEGKAYAFIARDSFAAEGAPQFDLISYSLLE